MNGVMRILPHSWQSFLGKKALAIVWLVGGIGVAFWLVFHVGPAAVGGALTTAGWMGLVAISGFHLIATTTMGVAWWRLRGIGQPWVFIWGRLLRDAGSEILPLSQLGGSALGARAIALRGIKVSVATASVIADITVEFLAEIAFVAVGVTMLTRVVQGSELARPFLFGLGSALVVATIFVLVQRRGLDLLARGATKFASVNMSKRLVAAAPLQAELRESYKLKRVWLSFVLHFVAWMLAPVEAWLALRFMGAKFDFTLVLILESLLYAMRSLSFLVPSALGVQEAIYVVLGTALGLTPGIALGLSLMKRGRDIALGVPALLSWQVVESRRR